MTNLEYVCQALREVGRADAAQILEMRTEQEWRDQDPGNWSIIRERAEPAGVLTPRRIIDVSMYWSRTKEGHDYWQKVARTLGEKLKRGDR